MRPSLIARLLTGEELAADDRRRLIETARRLGGLARAGDGPALLKGRHLAIAGTVAAPRCVDRFELAATALGARVSRILLAMPPDDAPQAADAAARVLPRLYDALDCRGMSAARALALQREAGVPVYLDLGCARHPLRRLLGELSTAADAPGDPLHALLQAVLVETLA